MSSTFKKEYSKMSALIFLKTAVENALCAGTSMGDHLLDMEELEQARQICTTLLHEQYYNVE